MTSSADEAREEIKEHRKSLIEIPISWLFSLADWLFPYPQEYWYRIKIHQMKQKKKRIKK